jgi:hypothetical protein
MKQYTLKVYPKGQARTAYRVIEISGDDTLDRLCDVILYAFDFDRDHLYEFSMSGRLYSDDNSATLRITRDSHPPISSWISLAFRKDKISFSIMISGMTGYFRFMCRKCRTRRLARLLM